MSNIMLIDACNLKCSYCFANEFVNVSRNEISLDAFSKALEFILGDGSESFVGIIGGEPTLHSQFDTLMRMAIADERTKVVMLYTNGLLLHEHWDVCCHAKTHLLINCNSPSDIGESSFKRLCDNLDVLLEQKMCKDRVTLGINMYKPDFEYRYLIDLLKKHKLDHVRVSITVPNVDGQRNTDAHAYFMLMKPNLIRFFHKLLENKIIPNFDCNKIPPCLVKQEEIEEFYRYFSDPFIAKNIEKSNIANRRVTCSPVVDIRQDLTAVRCFGLSSCTKQRIDNFKGIKDLKNYYYRTIDAYAWNSVYSPLCSSCYDRQVLSCSGGCLAFKIDEILQLAEYANGRLDNECAD